MVIEIYFAICYTGVEMTWLSLFISSEILFPIKAVLPTFATQKFSLFSNFPQKKAKNIIHRVFAK
jgi:hypothetical protein